MSLIMSLHTQANLPIESNRMHLQVLVHLPACKLNQLLAHFKRHDTVAGGSYPPTYPGPPPQ